MSSDDKLDHETWRLLEDKIFWDSKLFASVCAPRIRRDYERATREARANCASPKQAVGKKLDPVRVENKKNLPYLTRSEEEWLQSFRDGQEKVAFAIQFRNVLFAVLAFALILWFARQHYPDLASIFTGQMISMVPLLFPGFFAPYLKPWIVRQLGPTGCAFAAPAATVAMTAFYITLITAVILQFTNFHVAIRIFVPILPLVSILSFATAYFRKRQRILQNYREVWEILELPGLENILETPPTES